jgi:hypothetical protein
MKKWLTLFLFGEIMSALTDLSASVDAAKAASDAVVVKVDELKAEIVRLQAIIDAGPTGGATDADLAELQSRVEALTAQLIAVVS